MINFLEIKIKNNFFKRNYIIFIVLLVTACYFKQYY